MVPSQVGAALEGANREIEVLESGSASLGSQLPAVPDMDEF